MSDVACAQDLMRGFVYGRPGSNLKQKLGSAAASLKWTAGRCKAVFYGEARRIDAREMEQLRRTAAQKQELGEMADEHRELTERLARMEAMLALLVSEMGSPSLPRKGSAVRAARGAVGA